MTLVMIALARVRTEASAGGILRGSTAMGLVELRTHVANPGEADPEHMVYGLRQGKLRHNGMGHSHRNLHLHLVISIALFVLALAGWGAFAHAVLSAKTSEAELRVIVSRLTTERDRILEQQRTSNSELAAAQRGISGLISALEKSRAELFAAQRGCSVQQGN